MAKKQKSREEMMCGTFLMESKSDISIPPPPAGKVLRQIAPKIQVYADPSEPIEHVRQNYYAKLNAHVAR